MYSKETQFTKSTHILLWLRLAQHVFGYLRDAADSLGPVVAKKLQKSSDSSIKQCIFVVYPLSGQTHTVLLDVICVYIYISMYIYVYTIIISPFYVCKSGWRHTEFSNSSWLHHHHHPQPIIAIYLIIYLPCILINLLYHCVYTYSTLIPIVYLPIIYHILNELLCQDPIFMRISIPSISDISWFNIASRRCRKVWNQDGFRIFLGF